MVAFGCASRTRFSKWNNHFCQIMKNFRSFDTFDFCFLPDVFSEKKNGPSFRHEKAVNGIFQHENINVEIQMSVSKTANVYCQTLLDCSLKENLGIKNLGLKYETFTHVKDQEL